MLVLGVGSAGVESVGGGRVLETLIGAAVGIAVLAIGAVLLMLRGRGAGGALPGAAPVAHFVEQPKEK